MLILIILTIITLLYVLLKWNYSYWKRLNVPGPTPTFIVGNLGATFTMKKNFGDIVDEWYNNFATIPYIGYFKAFKPAIMVRDPDLIKDILIKDFPSFSENDFGFDEKEDELFASNPFILKDDKWRNARNILAPLFTANKVKTLFPLMYSAVEKLQKYILKQGPSKDIDAKDMAAKFTTENITRIAFSLNADCFNDTNSEFHVMGKKIFEPTILSGIKFMVILFVPSIMKIFPVALLPKEVDTWMRRLVKENLDSRKKAKLTHDDLLHMLLNLKEKHSLSETQLAGHALSFFTEGTETSSTALAFTLYETARNQDVQIRLLDEITDVLGKHNGEISFDALSEMTYLDRVVHETLRMYPVAPSMQKMCTQQYTLPKLPGHSETLTIKPGMSILIPVKALQWDPNYYPDPEVFNPERFTEEEKRNRHKALYLPFGEGPRMCLGMRFALAQIKLAVMSIVKDFHITVSANQKPIILDPKALLTHAKDGLLLNMKPRK